MKGINIMQICNVTHELQEVECGTQLHRETIQFVINTGNWKQQHFQYNKHFWLGKNQRYYTQFNVLYTCIINIINFWEIYIYDVV